MITIVRTVCNKAANEIGIWKIYNLIQPDVSYLHNIISTPQIKSRIVGTAIDSTLVSLNGNGSAADSRLYARFVIGPIGMDDENNIILCHFFGERMSICPTPSLP